MVDGLMVSLGVNEYAMSAVNLAIPFTNALFSIAVAAAETAVAIAIIINIYRNIRNIEVKKLNELKD